MLLQLNPPFQMDTPLGHGYAHVLRDDGQDFYWTVFLDCGAIVQFRNQEVRCSTNYTHGRGVTHERMRAIVGSDK